MRLRHRIRWRAYQNYNTNHICGNEENILGGLWT